MPLTYKPIKLGFIQSFSSKPNNPADELQGKLDALKGENGRAGLRKEGQGPLAPPSLVTQPFAGQEPVEQSTGAAPAAAVREEKDVEGLPAYHEGYEGHKEFMDWLQAPLTTEERAKRERAAHAVAGVGALGNVLSAFSNLAFAGDRAPSQTLPQAPDAASPVQRERDYWDKIRDRYLTWKMQDRQMGLREKQIAQQAERDRARLQYQTEKDRLDREFKKGQQKDLNEYRGQQMQYRREKDEADREQRSKQFDRTASQRDRSLGIQAMNATTSRDRLGLQREIHNEKMKSGGYGRRSGGDSKTGGNILSSPSNEYRTKTSFTSPDVINNLYEQLPDEAKVALEDSVPTGDAGLYGGYSLAKALGRRINSGASSEAYRQRVRDYDADIARMSKDDQLRAKLNTITSYIARNDEYAQELRRKGYLEDLDGGATDYSQYLVDDDDEDDDYSEFIVD